MDNNNNNTEKIKNVVVEMPCVFSCSFGGFKEAWKNASGRSSGSSSVPPAVYLRPVRHLQQPDATCGLSGPVCTQQRWNYYGIDSGH